MPSTHRMISKGRKRKEREEESTSSHSHTDENSVPVLPTPFKKPTSSSRKRSLDGPSSSRLRKESKSSSIEKAFEAWTEFSIARTKKLEREGRLDTSSKTSDPYSIEACIEVLSSLDGVDDAHYMKACRKFTDATWQTMFIRVPLERKLGWVMNL
ncbi:hypothetical protein F0562_018198 [Nyssa sinensis]|uniref:Uncharacterized protein n=1 Tax=Nyssa sinensis TaxID=561372 RepID=A0A5J4Z8V9_9ASTE|nr:hypothetical protein F0562_018198 [Nyssa sinensis]